MNSDWNNYYQLTKKRPPSKHLIEALQFVVEREASLDLGPGALKDSKYLLEQGFKEVIAVDAESLSDDYFIGLDVSRFKFINSKFIDFIFPKDKFNIVNAAYALPFNPKKSFPMVWSNIKDSIKIGGVFAGQFFGEKDEWNTGQDEMTFHTANDIYNLFSDFKILKFLETQKDGHTAAGQNKHWHVFDIIAKKNNYFRHCKRRQDTQI